MKKSRHEPLAARLRPTNFDTFVGQSHLVGPNTPLRLAIEKGHLHSMLLWGPPGSGKTTLARLISHYCHAEFIALSAVLAGVKDIREAIAHAKTIKEKENKPTILFIDEIHRFNKAQQDALLPFVEDGTVCFIGATTENPSFEVIHALLSRCRVYVLNALEKEALQTVLENALQDETHGLGKQNIILSPKAIDRIILSSDGDARRLLNILEVLSERVGQKQFAPEKLDDLVEQVIQQDYRRFDKQGDVFYEQISALHKAVRGTSPDGALYWFCRMLDGGCDPLYIARRVIRMASEDIGIADPRGLEIALNAANAYERLGSPEGELALAQAVVYLACAPKSTAVYNAFNQAMADVQKMPSYGVPTHLRNAPTKLMKQIGYGKNYRYDPLEAGGYSQGQTYFPPEMGETKYYYPTQNGLEVKILEKLESLKKR